MGMVHMKLLVLLLLLLLLSPLRLRVRVPCVIGPGLPIEPGAGTDSRTNNKVSAVVRS